DQHRRRRRLGDEVERAVLVDRDLDRHHRAPHRLGAGVVLLAEVHDGDAVRAQRRTDRRGGRRLTGLDLDLDEGGDLLLGHGSLPARGTGHSAAPPRAATTRPTRPAAGTGGTGSAQSLATWENSSSTGVSRPKMFTRTFIFMWSSLISTISPEKSANGPSFTRTDSCSSYSRRGRARLVGVSSAAASGTAMKPSTSLRDSGVGLLPAPTKPVTPGVLRITYQLSSSRSQRISR